MCYFNGWGGPRCATLMVGAGPRCATLMVGGGPRCATLMVGGGTSVHYFNGWGRDLGVLL